MVVLLDARFLKRLEEKWNKMRQTIASKCSKSGIFSINQKICEYYIRQTSACSAGQGRCLHDGISEDCTMLKSYDHKLQGTRPKTFEERYGENWRTGGEQENGKRPKNKR